MGLIPGRTLGLGMLHQAGGKIRASMDILEKGLSFYPKDESMRMCMGVNHMNLGEFEPALEHLRMCENNPDADLVMASCYRAMGKPEMAGQYEGRAKKTGRVR